MSSSCAAVPGVEFSLWGKFSFSGEAIVSRAKVNLPSAFPLPLRREITGEKRERKGREKGEKGVRKGREKALIPQRLFFKLNVTPVGYQLA